MSSQQSMQFWLSDSNGQVRDIPSQFSDGEESDPLHMNDPCVPDELISTRQQTNKREHTAPKVLLSVMHKILYWQSNTTRMYKELLSQVNKKQNNSTPIKFFILAQKIDLIEHLKENFPKEADFKINEYYNTKGWSDRRLATAMEWKSRIERALRQRNHKKAFNVIWQGNNHPGRYVASEQQVASFKKKIVKIKKSQLIKSK